MIRAPPGGATGLQPARSGVFREPHEFQRLHAARRRLGRERRVFGPGAKQPPSERVYDVHQSRLRAPVLGQRAGFRRVVVDQGSEQARIGALEAHDGLLAIADDQRGNARGPQPPEQVELERVGVLELVHNHAVDTAGQRAKHGWFRAQQATCHGDHVVVVDQACLPLRIIVVPQGPAGGAQQCGDMLDGVLVRSRMDVQPGRRRHPAGQRVVPLRQAEAPVGRAQRRELPPQLPVAVQCIGTHRPGEVVEVPDKIPAGSLAGPVVAVHALGKILQQRGSGVLQGRAQLFRSLRFAVALGQALRCSPNQPLGPSFRSGVNRAQEPGHRYDFVAEDVDPGAIAGMVVGIAERFQPLRDHVRLVAARQRPADQRALLVVVQEARLR